MTLPVLATLPVAGRCSPRSCRIKMTEARTLELARRRLLHILEDDPRNALASCAAEDPLGLTTRAAALADDEGFLYDPSDLMVDGYVHIVREPQLLRDVQGWLDGPFLKLSADIARECPSPALVDALTRALGIDEERVEVWVDHFRTLALNDRRDVLALLRAGSKSFRKLCPGRAIDLKADVVAAHRIYSIFRGLMVRTMA